MGVIRRTLCDIFVFNALIKLLSWNVLKYVLIPLKNELSTKNQKWVVVYFLTKKL